jgi:hypothetical protein
MNDDADRERLLRANLDDADRAAIRWVLDDRLALAAEVIRLKARVAELEAAAGDASGHPPIDADPPRGTR